MGKVETLEAIRKFELVLLAIVVLYGGAIRLEALHHAYPPPDGTSPALQRIEGALAAAVGAIRPTAEPIEPQRYPYRFDAKSYLDAARAMRHFYEARLREPLFVFATKMSLAALGDQDRGVSLASTICSILLLLPVFLIGRMLGGPATGLLAAALLAFAAAALLYLRSPAIPSTRSTGTPPSTTSGRRASPSARASHRSSSSAGSTPPCARPTRSCAGSPAIRGATSSPGCGRTTGPRRSACSRRSPSWVSCSGGGARPGGSCC